MPSPDSIDEQSARSVVESGRTEKSKLAHVGGNPQRSDVAHRIYGIVPVSFDLSVRFRTALVPTPEAIGGLSVGNPPCYFTGRTRRDQCIADARRLAARKKCHRTC
ncbi:hypothetical protein AGR1_28470 [Agrobacterium sp. B1(2019)]|nr:hypothetical protein AGR1_28470 [Agrobacterium sp. B1(2019)]